VVTLNGGGDAMPLIGTPLAMGRAPSSFATLLRRWAPTARRF